MHASVKEKMVELKREKPGLGIRKISQTLRRWFFLPGSPETVRETLHDAGLMEPKRKRQEKRNVEKVRRFERSKPNQMWQSDITMFRLGGEQVYLIGYIDDYSRFITAHGLYSKQKSAHVLEVYGQGVVEYGPPKEMLTDNGRQYTSWRGITQFEAQMKKDHVKHIKSQPHHPMTLGKIERFWETIFQEFLSKAQFTSFEDARERIRHWVQYYNHRRPHQGIGGLCPADRFFEVATELKKTIEQGVQDNVLELALKGKSEGPFYMVGRMRGQSVVLMAEKGKLKLRVDGKESEAGQEIVYNLPEKGDITGGNHGEGQGKGEDEPSRVEVGDTRCGGAVQGGTFCVDGEPQTYGDMPGDEHQVDDASPLAEAGHGGNASGADAASSADAGALAPAKASSHGGTPGGVIESQAVGDGIGPLIPAIAANTGTPAGNDNRNSGEVIKEQEQHGTGSGAGASSGERNQGAGTRTDYPGSQERKDDGDGGSEFTRHIETALLRIGAPGAIGDGGCALGRGSGPAGEPSGGPGEGGAEAESEGARAGSNAPSPDLGGSGGAVTVQGVAA
jgi:transposase InsO family protein